MQDKNKIIIGTLSAVVVILVIVLFAKSNPANEVDTTAVATTTVSGTTTTGTATVKPATTTATPKPAALNAQGTALPAQFVLMVGNTYVLPEGSIFTLKNVNDSRCPTDENIACVWAGNVTVKANIKKGSYTKDIEMTVGGASYTHSGYKITLDDVTPDKGLQSVVTKEGEYKLTFTVAK